MMLQNANLKSDSMNAVTFQLTTKLSMKQNHKQRTEFDQATRTNLIQRVTDFICIKDENDGGIRIDGTMKIIRINVDKGLKQCIEDLKISQGNITSDEYNSFSVKETAAVLAQE